MTSIYDILSAFLFLAAAGLLALRWRHERPRLGSYALIALVSVVGSWLGHNGGGAAAVALLIAGAFFTLHIAGQPFSDDAEENS